MRILVIGASGLVGEQIFLSAKRAGFDVQGTYFRNKRKGMHALDVTDVKSVAKLVNKLNPGCIVHSSALTNVDYCENHKEEAWLANAVGTRNVAKASKEIKVVYISTDYIFDGRNGPYPEDAVPCPINYYGLTKLAGESCVSVLEEHMIVRSTWIFDLSSDTKNFLHRLISTTREGKEISVPTDQIANPTLARSLAENVVKLIKKNFSGVINIAGSDRLSRHAFALKAARHFSLDTRLIKGVRSEELGQAAERPKNAGFNLEKAEKHLGRMPSIGEMLKAIQK